MAKKKERPEVAEAPEVKTENAVSAEDARRILREEQNAKTEACMREVDGVLRRHGCALDVSMTVTTRGVTPHVRVVPQSPQ